MKYLKIVNQGEITKPALEMLGFSAKRDDQETIGEKGTGLKFSRLQALRANLEVVVATSEFINTLSSKDLDSQNAVVCFNYEDPKGKVTTKESFYTTMAGFSEWTDEWFIVREMLQNAIDETVIYARSQKVDVGGIEVEGFSPGLAYASKYVRENIEVVEQIEFAKPNHTVVYIGYSARVQEVYNHLDDFINYETLTANIYGSIKPKRKERLRVYKKGILVHASKTLQAVYDYDYSDLELTEAREVKNTSDIQAGIGKILSHSNTKYMREVLKACSEDTKRTLQENFLYEWYIEKKPEWAKAFIEEFGTEVILHNSREVLSLYLERVQLSGKKVVVIYGGLYDALKATGVITTMQDLTSNPTFKYEVISLDKLTEFEVNELKVAGEACKRVFKWHGNLAVFEDSRENEIWGAYSTQENKILINRQVISMGRRKLIQTLTEELIHATSGAEDNSRKFQNVATDIIAELLLGGSMPAPILDNSTDLPF